MAKSSRASVVKKNNQRLKKHVFGPVESARNERLNAKLLELAAQPKAPRSEMEIEQDGGAKDVTEEVKGDQADEDVDMDAEDSTQATLRRKSSLKKQKAGKKARIEKTRHRKPKNKIAFPTHPKKAKRR